MTLVVNKNNGAVTIPTDGEVIVGNVSVEKINVVKDGATTTVWEKVQDRVVYQNTYTFGANGVTFVAGTPTVEDADYITTAVMDKFVDVTAGNSMDTAEVLFTLSERARSYSTAKVTLSYYVSTSYGRSALLFNEEMIYDTGDYATSGSDVQEITLDISLAELLIGTARYIANNRSSYSGAHCYISFIITKIVLE